MSGRVFAADEILVDVCFDAARYRLGHLAREGVLLIAAEYAYGAGTIGLVETAEPSAGMSRLAGLRDEDIGETPVPAFGCSGKRSGPTAPCTSL
jgi:hypothetical protein